MITPYYRSADRDFTLLQGDCVELLSQFHFEFDAVFADPPYFLSSGGISMQAGKVVCVDKGEWDKVRSSEEVDAFNRAWLTECRKKLKPRGSIWVSGTYHNIFSVAHLMTELGFKILNVITWQKSNPPANISCRFFTYSTEFVIWARRERKRTHVFNYELMRYINGGKQMTDVWRLPAIAPWEKVDGRKHPTQKPLSLLTRIILASTPQRGWVLDPFSGSGTTGIAANLCGRRYLGIEQDAAFLDLSCQRRQRLEDGDVWRSHCRHLPDLLASREFMSLNAPEEVAEEQGDELPF